MRRWKWFWTVTQDYIIDNSDMLLICWPRFRVMPDLLTNHLNDDTDEVFEKAFRKALLTKPFKVKETVCLNPKAREYFTGEPVFTKRALKIHMNISGDKYPSVVIAWVKADRYTLEVLKCD